MMQGAHPTVHIVLILLPLIGPGLVATSVYGFIPAGNEFIIDTFNDQAQQKPDGLAAAEPGATRDVLGTAGGRVDPDRDPGGDLLPHHSAQHRDRLTAGAVKG